MRPIAISLSPNLEIDDTLLACKTLLTPWVWMKGDGVKKVEHWTKRYFNTPYVFFFDSGRSGEYAILKSLGIGKGDEVLLQAFTCVAVPNSVLWVGAKPVYVDIEKDSLNMDVGDLKEKITKNTKAIIVQHTFGTAANMNEIKKVASKNKLTLIEDCAHALGGSFQGRKLGTLGKAAFFSLGRDKVISSVFGGIVITKDKKLATELFELQKNTPMPGVFWVAQQLLHPISFALILPLYNFLSIGKLLLYSLQKMHLLSMPIVEKEKAGQRPSNYPRRFPNALAILALNQLNKLERFNKHREKLANFYANSLKDTSIEVLPIKKGDIYLRFPIFFQSKASRNNAYKFLKRNKILIGNWYSNIIDPEGIDFGKIGYMTASCFQAERIAGHILNLPTSPTLRKNQAEKVVKFLKKSNL